MLPSRVHSFLVDSAGCVLMENNECADLKSLPRYTVAATIFRSQHRLTLSDCFDFNLHAEKSSEHALFHSIACQLTSLSDIHDGFRTLQFFFNHFQVSLKTG